MGDESSNSGPVSGVQFNLFIEKPLYPLGFVPAQVAFRSFNAHYLAAAGNLEAAFGTFMGF
jgi:hypothetical protein